jgi:Leucine-rich repeat (LRR) protein
MMPEQADKVEREEPVGPHILDFYLSYLHGNPNHLPIEAKKALRLCSKKFKYFFDASIHYATVAYQYGKWVHPEFKGKFIQFKEYGRFAASGDIPKSFKSLDLTCRMLPSLKALEVWMATTIGQLTCLTKLQVHRTSSSSLPASFSQLTLLESLTLEPFPATFNDLRPVMGCKALVDLTIRVHSTEMMDSADFLLKFPKLKSLNLTGAGGDACLISENFGRLQLTSLVLNLPNILSLPESLGDISSLVSFELCTMKGLTHLPASLGNLTALEKLTLSCVELIAVPESIGNLKRLTYIALNACMNISTFPCSIGELESLVGLIIKTCNALTELPESMGNLKSLKTLWLGYCGSLITLPDSYTRLNLNRFMIISCEQLVEPPVETLWQQFGTAFSYNSAKRYVFISNGQIEGEEEEAAESETEEDNDSNVSGSQTEEDSE